MFGLDFSELFVISSVLIASVFVAITLLRLVLKLLK